MASLYLILALLVQCSHIYADIQPQKNETDSVSILAETTENISHVNAEVSERLKHQSTEEVIKEGNVISNPEKDDLLNTDFRAGKNDWLDAFFENNPDSYPSSSVSIMAQAINFNKTAEDLIEDIKEATTEMTLAFESEVTNLFSQVLTFVNNEPDNNTTRKKRSIETPVDCSQLVMKLLKHIKNNNECQNIAIEKMMSAQEIAEKYGVEFSPDPEIISDLALASNQHAIELTSILRDAFDQNTTSRAIATTNTNNEINELENNLSEDNSTCYASSAENAKCDVEINSNSTTQGHVHIIPSKNTVPASHVHYNHVGYNYYSYPTETQVTPPPVQYNNGPSVSAKPTFYDTISYNPNEYYLPYCSMDQMTYPSLFSFEDPLNLEPELVGEEYEETLSSRVIIEQDDEPGSATVNHVMTYTVSEKAHFKSPQIEKLPQQVQYYFYLM